MANEGAKLVKMWATKTPEQAHATLSLRDIQVTNQSDKELQLGKLLKLNELAKDQYLQLSERRSASGRASSAWTEVHATTERPLAPSRQAASIAVGLPLFSWWAKHRSGRVHPAPKERPTLPRSNTVP